MRDLMVDTQRLKAEARLLRKRAPMLSDPATASAYHQTADLLDEIAVDIERAASLSHAPQPIAAIDSQLAEAHLRCGLWMVLPIKTRATSERRSDTWLMAPTNSE
jgi:hypothetical protein